MRCRRFTTFLIAACFLNCFAQVILAQSSQQFEHVIIEAPKPYTRLVGVIQALGGSVTYQYKHVNAVAARVPISAMETLRDLAGSESVIKDEIVPLPKSASGIRTVKVTDASPIRNLNEAITAGPAAYKLNNLGLNLEGLHANGYTGGGVTIAVVDSGVRPNYPVLDSDNSVVGGVDLVGDGLGFSNSQNDPHGTFIAGLISGNTQINIANTALASSIQEHFPGALVGTDLPLIGTAPASSIYVVRVFGANAAAGAPESRIIAGIDHVIDLKLKYLQGLPSGVDVQVCNLSLGNATFFAGRDLFDRSVDALLANGIIPIVSAGDVGPSGLTISSPATSLSAIAVGAASPAANERVQNDVSNFLGYGIRYRPSGATQVAWFSGRGPSADGRPSPHVVATGVGNFGQGYGSTADVTLVSGTSFSAPLVAGVAAVLRQAYPHASAAQIRNAIIGSGNPDVVGPGFTALDQGAGFPDAQSAFDNFAKFSNAPPHVLMARSSVATNIRQGTGLQVMNGSLNLTTGNLAPGRRAEILYDITPNTSQVVITVANFRSNPNVSPQNAFPEEIYLQVHTAKTSQIGAFGDYFDIGTPFITGGTFAIDNPETGIMRITLSGVWTNESAVSADVAVKSFTDPTPQLTTQGIIRNHELIVFPVTVPQGISMAEFRLWFRNDWGNYPVSDVDLILFDPNLNPNTDGARLNDPELARIFNPLPGTWFVVIVGFNVPSGSDKYELRVALDGKVIQ